MKINSEYSASLILARCRETPAGNHRWHLRFDESLNPDIIIAARPIERIRIIRDPHREALSDRSSEERGLFDWIEHRADTIG